jgi:group II intron reverse transcriptase/maturase
MKMSNQQKVQTDPNPNRPKKRKDMSPEERLQLLQRKLYLKAKQEKQYRFYILYDKIFLDYVLQEAYKQAKRAGGSPGIDRQSFAEIEKQGRDQFLKDLKEDLRKRTYRPKPVKRVWIDKEDGSKRPLGIPTIRDRVAQTACKMIIEPLFEADFEDCSHGFRPKHSAHDAIRQIKEHLKADKTEVYDADLSKYFDTIPHDKLMRTLEMRISDPRVLHLIKLWLKTPVIEDGKTKGGKKNTKGTPQGGVISPLLANIYLHLLDRIVNKPNGMFAKYQVKMVRYADDFVLMGKKINEKCLCNLREVLNRMELTINETKSKLIQAQEVPFNFLGFTVRYDRSVYNRDSRFWNIRPSDKSRKRVRQNIKAKLKTIGHYPPEAVVDVLNPIVRGWINYYSIEKVSYMQVDKHKLTYYLRDSLTRYYNRKSQRRSRMYGLHAFDILVRKYGLVNPYRSSGKRPVYA